MGLHGPSKRERNLRKKRKRARTGDKHSSCSSYTTVPDCKASKKRNSSRNRNFVIDFVRYSACGCCTDGLTRSSIPSCPHCSTKNKNKSKKTKQKHKPELENKTIVHSVFNSDWIDDLRDEMARPWPFLATKTTIPSWAAGSKSIQFDTHSRACTDTHTVRDPAVSRNWRRLWSHWTPPPLELATRSTGTGPDWTACSTCRCRCSWRSLPDTGK